MFVVELHKLLWVNSWGWHLIQPISFSCQSLPKWPFKALLSKEWGGQMLLILGLGH